MKVLIQGAGIAGLALAQRLQKQGIDFHIYEKRERMEAVGAGITLSSNALASLAEVIDIEALARAGQELHELQLLDTRGRVLSVMPSRLNEASRSGIGIHRGLLQQHLLKGISDDKISLGTHIAQINYESESVRVRTSSGYQESFDFVVGADGLYSGLRQYVAETSPVFSGYTCWRFVLPFQLREPNRAGEMWGEGKRFGYVQISPELVYAYMTLNVPQGLFGKVPTDLPLSTLKTRFAGFGGEAARILESLNKETKIIHNDLEEIVLKKWSHHRVLLIGDAAHGMTPNLGQGAAMALEDALVLAKVWKEDLTVQSLEEFERRRRKRVKWVQDQSRTVGRLGQMESPCGRWIRDTVLACTPNAMVKKNLEKLLYFSA